MAKHRRSWSEKTYYSLIKEGRGQGTGADYNPWIHIQDFPSLGMVSRVHGYTSHRTHHLLSRNETAFFYLMDFDNDITDIQEQFPLLDVLDTVRIAEHAGIRHPRDPKSHYPYVLTSDFVLTTQNGHFVCSIKESKALKNPRTLEKLEIERRYWKERGIDWKIVTEKDINFDRARNIEWIFRSADLPERLGKQTLDAALSYFKSAYTTSSCPVVRIAADTESYFHLEDGYGISIFQYLLLTRQLEPCLDEPLDLSLPRSPHRKEVFSWIALSL